MEQRLDSLALEELATYRQTGFALTKWLQSRFAQPELEHAYCTSCIRIMRNLIIFFCSLFLVLEIHIFVLSHATFYVPRVNGVVIEGGDA